MQAQLGEYVVEIAEDYGPRITGFRRGEGPNLFADLGDLSLPHPEGDYVLGGGHRLWAAPEIPHITYWPDADEVEIADEHVLAVVGAAGPFGKTMTVKADGGGVVVGHALRNLSDVPRHAAPWAITQLVPGGTAALPLGSVSDDRQASSTVVAWPYTRFDDPAWSIQGAVAVVGGTRPDEFKVGTVLEGRTMAYLMGTTAFCKSSPRVPGTIPDRGASGQVYVNADFVELETLGPLAHLAAGAEVTHEERWWVVEGVESVEALTELVT